MTVLPKPVFVALKKWVLAEIDRQKKEQGFVAVTAGWAKAYNPSYLKGVSEHIFQKAFPKVAQACGLMDDGTKTQTWTDDPTKVHAFLRSKGISVT